MTIHTDRSSVIRAANLLLHTGKAAAAPDAALSALREFYGLPEGAKITGSNDIAICLGYWHRPADQDLLDEIVRDLAAKLSVIPFKLGQVCTVRATDSDDSWVQAEFKQYVEASTGRPDRYYFECPRGTLIVRGEDLADRVREASQPALALAA